MFSGTSIKITVEGKKHLGALGTDVFGKSFISAKVEKWVDEIKQLSIIAESHPHAAYSALTNGLVGRWTFLMRVVPGISEMLQPLEDAIRLHLLPPITGHDALSDAERRVLALPVRDGGLGIPVPTTAAANQLKSSTFITQPLVNLLPLQQNADTVSGLCQQHSHHPGGGDQQTSQGETAGRSNCPPANTSCIPSEITGTCI